MAVIDDLVSSGLSGTQATEVIAVGAGTGSDAALVSQGFSTTQATQILAAKEGDATDVELVQQGLSSLQATTIIEAVGSGPTPSETYTYSFDGSSSGIQYPTTTDLEFGSGDFTIEFYMLASASQQPYATITDASTSNNATYVGVGNNGGGSSGYVSFKADSNVSGIVTTVPYSTSEYQHIACVRSGSNGYIFIDGVLQASTTGWSGATNAYLSGGALGRSYFGGGFGGDNTYTGYLSNFRVTKRALYTANFTAPTGTLPVVANTVLLTLQSSTVIDVSPSNLTLTALSVLPTPSILA